ncbi:cardioacceleratory peptide receptor-like protein [Dinothrombium tinctorium]|uniref:Cardioacceleratory peptide receptor-like protein n=1 Tax=Dinothrombium tinctorium TaxID=1965070 RepID=A0A3S3NNU4_9ACAR|nr:cardioacceleratory peptide receptor-like protein [Dinothrombium tinctorium]RWS06350.1 cardioacceleratory peptide receptor-like protein [Dinothrombium tinctorium]
MSCDKHFNLIHFDLTEQLTFLWIIFIMIVFGNCSVLVTLLMSKNRKTRMNFFIMHLAIAVEILFPLLKAKEKSLSKQLKQVEKKVKVREKYFTPVFNRNCRLETLD